MSKTDAHSRRYLTLRPLPLGATRPHPCTRHNTNKHMTRCACLTHGLTRLSPPSPPPRPPPPPSAFAAFASLLFAFRSFLSLLSKPKPPYSRSDMKAPVVCTAHSRGGRGGDGWWWGGETRHWCVCATALLPCRCHAAALALRSPLYSFLSLTQQTKSVSSAHDMTNANALTMMKAMRTTRAEG